MKRLAKLLIISLFLIIVYTNIAKATTVKGTIYGPDFEDYFKMMDILQKGKMRLIGDGCNYVPFVHVDDVAKAIKNSLNSKTKPGVYLLSGDPITQEETFKLVSKELGIESPKKKINKHIAIMLLQASKFFRKLFGAGDFLTLEHLNILSNNRIFDCSKAKKELKFRPRSTTQGIKEMAEIYLKRKGN